MIGDEWRSRLHAYLAGILRTLAATPIIVGGTRDHVHVLVRVNADQRISDLVRELKKVSSVWGKEYWHAFGWQEGYAAFAVSHSLLAATVRYIENQEEHHRQVSSADELRALLIEAGIAIDERFFQ